MAPLRCPQSEPVFGPCSRGVAPGASWRTRRRRRASCAARDGYDSRPKVVHGARLRKLDAAGADQLLGDAEDLVRRGLSKVLLDPELIATFNSGRREECLDGLVFGPR